MFQDGRLAIDNPETSNIVDGIDMLDAQILLDAFIWKFDVKGNDFALDMSFAKMVEDRTAYKSNLRQQDRPKLS